MEDSEASGEKDLIRPVLDSDVATSFVRELYGMEVRKIRELNGYDDRNFHIEIGDCENPFVDIKCEYGYTLKVINKVDSTNTNFIDTMDQALLNCHQNGLHVPIPVKNKSGNLWSLKLIPDNKNRLNSHVVRLLTYLPGEVVCRVPYTAEVLFQWGRLLARFHQAMQNFSQDVIKERKTLWSLFNVPKLLEYLPYVKMDERRRMIKDIVDIFQKTVLENIQDLPSGVIHGDFNESNILVRKTNNGHEVYGILDFGDIQVAPFIFDVSVMLAYTTLDCKTMDPAEACGYALAGYTSVLTLLEREYQILRICMLSRLSQSLVLGAYNYSLDPSNQYVLSTAKTGWKILHKLWNLSEEYLLELWRNINNNYNK